VLLNTSQGNDGPNEAMQRTRDKISRCG
jgi:hypothetical protein